MKCESCNAEFNCDAQQHNKSKRHRIGGSIIVCQCRSSCHSTNAVIHNNTLKHRIYLARLADNEIEMRRLLR
jgi:hypothetical protein